jgi:hypothetical protein
MNKAKLPAKTKIAIWWLIVVGIVLTIGLSGLLLLAIIFSIPIDSEPAVPNLVLYFFLPFCGIFTLISGIFLRKESKQAWKVAAVVLFIAIIYSLGICLYIVIHHCDNLSYMIPIVLLIGSVIYLTPLIIIIVDRKNYFAMLYQRELKKELKAEKPESNH